MDAPIVDAVGPPDLWCDTRKPEGKERTTNRRKALPPVQRAALEPFVQTYLMGDEACFGPSNASENAEASDVDRAASRVVFVPSLWPRRAVAR